ncbi:MAG: DUF4157 domain-containing protein, partial [Myxococcota bacterium]
MSAHIGGPATEACDTMNAKGFATGNSVAFKESPDLPTAAHEAAHVVQQRGGVWLSGGVGRNADRYEIHADRVADRVVKGESAADLLSEFTAGGGQSSAVQAKAVQRDEDDSAAANDEALKEAREALADRFLQPWQAKGALRGLLGRTDSEAVSVRNQLVARCRSEQIFWSDHAVGWAQRVIAAHQGGTDDVYYPGPSFLVRETVAVDAYAEVAEDEGLTQLSRDIELLQRFYSLSHIYGADLPSYHGRIRTMLAFLAAGQPVDHWDFWECDNWLEKDVFSHVLNPYVGHRILGNSNALKKYQDCYNDLQAVRLQMQQRSPDNPYDSTGRGMDKAGLMSLPAETPQYETISRDQTRLDWQEAIDRAEKLLQSTGTRFPGDIHTAVQKLRMMRDHSPYSSDQQRVDRLIAQLEELFVSTNDPDFSGRTPSSAVEFDASQPFGVSALTAVLGTLGNEPGEGGNLTFKLSGKAALGTGIINGYVKGWAELALGYSVSDTLTCVLGFDVNAAIGAGFSLAGLVEAGGEVGGGFGMKARFANPTEVANWIFGQMAAVNQRAGVRLFPLLGASEDLPEVSPTVLSQRRAFARGEASADIGVAAANAEVSKEIESTDFSRDGEDLQTGLTETTSYSVGAMAKIGKIAVRGGYTFTGTDVQNDINPSNNGLYHNHKVNVG